MNDARLAKEIIRTLEDEGFYAECPCCEPLNDYDGKVKLGLEFAVSNDNIREHQPSRA